MHSDHLHYFHQATARDQVAALMDRVRLDPAYRPARIRRLEAALQVVTFVVIAVVLVISARASS